MKRPIRPFKGYIPLFLACFRASWSLHLSFRMNFVLEVLMNLSFLFTTFLTVSFLLDHVGRIGPWNREEFLLFLSFVFVLNQLHYLFFAYNFFLFAQDIRDGDMDFHLLKPPSDLFVLFAREQAPPALISAAAALGALIYFGLKAGLLWMHWVLMPFLILLGLGLSFLLEVFISFFNFFTTGGHVANDFRRRPCCKRLPHSDCEDGLILSDPARRLLMPFLLAASAPGRFFCRPLLFLLDFMAFSRLRLSFALLLRITPSALKLYKSPSSCSRCEDGLILSIKTPPADC